MRNFQKIDTASVNDDTSVLVLTCQQYEGMPPHIGLRREGTYVAIACSYGPLEIALRPRYADLARVLARLRPVDGLQTTRQVGTGQAYLALGLQTDGDLVMRPTIVADATGHLTFNLVLTDSVRQTLFEWLAITDEE
jgi:hypothetical protein